MKTENIIEETKKVKFDIGNLLPIGLTIVVLGIALAYGMQVMGDIKTDLYDDNIGVNCNATVKSGCGAAYNATGESISGVAKIPNKLPMIVTVVVAAVIIGIIVRYLMFK